MPKCPKCGYEIYHLINCCRAIEKFFFSLDENGIPTYDYLDSYPQDEEDEGEYACPQCDAILFHDEESAVEFLKGGG